MADAGDIVTLAQFGERIASCRIDNIADMIDLERAASGILGGYVPRKLSRLERLQVFYTDRVRAAWLVLIGKAWAEEY